MRYRAYNVMEALRLVGVASEFVDDRLLPGRLGEVLAFDLVVLVRRRSSPEIELFLEFADRHRIPVVCDLDDYLFDREVLPHSEWLGQQPIEYAEALVNQFRELVSRCPYYTGSTPYLIERAARLGVSAHLIRNGLNSTQLEMSRIARETVEPARGGPDLWIGYFSGTQTHQSDFGLIAPVVVRLLAEFPSLGLVVAGDLDLAEFPEFSPVADRIERRPFVDWTLLPGEIARVDINVIPLVLSPFTEAKSNLKYYEAAVLKIPSVASATEVFRSCITHGSNGFLASSPDQWYAALRSLITDPEVRRLMGQRAYEHAHENYLPAIVGEEASCVYREVLRRHRSQLGADDGSPTIVAHFADLPQVIADRSPALVLCHELSKAGAHVTIQLDALPAGFAADQARSAVSAFLNDEPGFTYQVGGEVPCADILLATDASSALDAWESRDRARWTAYLIHEYEPARLAKGAARARVIRSYSLGLDILALEPVVANLLARHGRGKVTDLSFRIGAEPIEFGGHTDPDTVLVISSTRAVLPELVWNETRLALDQVRADHPHIRIVLGGGAAAWSEATGIDSSRIAQIDGEDLLLLLAQRPVCVVLCPCGGPPRVHDMVASGCPTIIVKMPGEVPCRDAELTHGVIEVRPDGLEISRGIDSLLVDRVRLGSLILHAARYLSNLPRAADAARALIERFRAFCDIERNAAHGHQPALSESIHRLGRTAWVSTCPSDELRSGRNGRPAPRPAGGP
jgi:glycosyltransferase involved in cell wall biosynthesis